MTDKVEGTPYSVAEAKMAARINSMDEYHRALLLWLVARDEQWRERVEAMIAEIRKAMFDMPPAGHAIEIIRKHLPEES